MGALYFLKRDPVNSRSWYEKTLEEDPDSIDALSGLVGLDLSTGRPAAALARLHDRLQKKPKDAPVLLLLARAYAVTRDFGKAEEALRSAIEADPNGFESYGMLGQLLYEQGRLQEGRREFEKLLELRPRAIPALTMIGVILRREGKTDEAAEQYRKVLAIDSQAPVAANNLAWIYAEQGRNLDEAVILARAAKKKLPDVLEVSDTLGWVYYRTGQPEALNLALPFLQECVERAPSNPLYRYHYGAALARAGKTADARAQLEQAVKLDPQFHGAAESRRILATLQ
jgi:tetratricopeptide (TPR) repeat protein